MGGPKLSKSLPEASAVASASSLRILADPVMSVASVKSHKERLATDSRIAGLGI